MRRAQSAWQMPPPEQQRGPVRSPSSRYASSNMSRATSASSLYGLGGPQSQLRSPDAYQQPQGPSAGFYNGGMGVYSPQSSQPRTPMGLQQQSYGRPHHGYDGGMATASPIVDYSAYGGNAFPTGLVANSVGPFQDYSQGMPGAMRYEDRARSIRSPLLEEFRANRHRRWDLAVRLASSLFLVFEAF
jgi:hypothetical protein